MNRILFLFICLAPMALRAQQDPMVSQHMFSGHFINPAYAGSHPYANITALGRKQWVGFDGAPFTTYLSFDMPVKNKRLGVGGLLSSDQIGVTSRLEAVGTIAYHLPVGDRATLSAGLSAGITHYHAELTKLTIWDQNDQTFVNNINGKILPVAGLGIYFYTERFYAGLSIPNVISYKPGTAINIGMNDVPFLERHYFGTIGYAIPAGKNLDIKPSVMVKYVPNSPLQADLSLHFFFYKTLWVGATYRSGDGLVGMAEYQATKNLRVGYAYDMSLSHLQNYNSGSHEIMLAWDFVKDETIRYKSPRFF
ncbi:MAG TPA: type IX secretion system membrane protein PorP/SprF [Bacteroidia bacterium]|nr:type IX secretion system membrane protein PorP/SprF [Bacteroidia bacterium]